MVDTSPSRDKEIHWAMLPKKLLTVHINVKWMGWKLNAWMLYNCTQIANTDTECHTPPLKKVQEPKKVD